MTQYPRRDETVNPFASPASVTSHVLFDDSEPALVGDLRAFVGKNADYYLGKWAPRLNDPGKSAGANFAAFFLSGFWLPYRKMYKLGLIFYGFIIAELLAETVFFVSFLHEPEAPEALSRIVGFVISIVCAAYGNRWYLAHAQRVIAETRAEGLEGAALRERLSKLGGMSITASLAMFAGFMLVIFALYPVLVGILIAMK